MHWWIAVAFVVVAAAVLCALICRGRAAERADEDREVRLVSVEEAVRRARCLGAIVARANVIEGAVAMARGQSAEMERVAAGAVAEQYAEMEAGFRADGLWQAFSAYERRLMEKRVGSWTPRELIDATWRAEALGALEWALGLRPSLFPYDEQHDPAALVSELNLSTPHAETLARCRLRSEEEISEARSAAELWLWRARTSQLKRNPAKYQPPPGVTFEEIISIAAQKAGEDGLFTPIENDFPAFGKPYRALSDEELSTMGSIASERLYGLNWLCGFSADWDKVPTDT